MVYYIYRKLQIMKQLGIYITLEQKQYMENLRNEVQVDNYAKYLRRLHYGD